jgi:hypothetical protein
LVACSDHSGPQAEGPELVIAGRLETDLGAPIEGGLVWVTVWDVNKSVPRADSVLLTDAAGRFAGTLVIDSLLATGFLQIDVRPPLGSGLTRAFGYDALGFDAAGRADTSGILFTVSQVAPPVPEGDPASLDPALLQGMFSGETVPPATMTGVAYLDLDLTPTADSVYGRYDIDFSASTACGDGNGDVSGEVRNDTLFLRLVSDSFPGWDGIVKVNSFIAMTYSASADTLILRYPSASGPCSWGSPAALRLIRQ